MTTIDKIRAEIDRRYEENREKARYDDYYRGMNDGLDLFESFLDTLEEPASEDLEDCLELNEAAGEYERNNRCSVLGNVDIIDAFKAGAKWLAGQGLTQVCRVKADYDSHGADYGVRFLRIDLPDDTPVGEEIIVKIIPKTW